MVAPNTALNVCEPAPNSGVLVLPTAIAPARLMRSTRMASSRRHIVLENRRTKSSADTRRFHQILMRDRQTVQRTERSSARLRLVRLARVLSRLLGDQRHNGIHFRIHPLNLLQVRVHNFARAQFLAGG